MMNLFKFHAMALGFLAVMESAMIASAQPVPTAQRPTISVLGEALVHVQPDRVLVTLGVETFDADVQIAKKKNNDLIARAFAVIKETGIPAADVQTDYLSLEPRYSNEYNNNPPKFLGYTSRNTFVVTVRDVTKLDPVLSALLAAGINRIQGIEFQTTELKKYREQAREMALLAAKEKAEKMAATLGRKIGGPLQITENQSSVPWNGYGRAGAMSQNAAVSVPSSELEETETVSLGKIPVKANVSVTFLLLPNETPEGGE
jgi:uncharacterized protein YggE